MKVLDSIAKLAKGAYRAVGPEIGADDEKKVVMMERGFFFEKSLLTRHFFI